MALLLLSVVSLTSSALAFPGMVAGGPANIHPRQSLPSNLPLSSQEDNSGPIPSLVFDPTDQFVDVRPGTLHQFIAPTSTDERGPCPGLNVAANHGFLPHNGIATIQQSKLPSLRQITVLMPSIAISGLSEAYSFGDEFAAALAVVAIALTGDPITETWSIGGPYSGGLLSGLLTNPEGISFSHNSYESDASPARVSWRSWASKQ